MRALSQCLLATFITTVLALSTPARSLDRTSNIEWRTFTVQDFGTTVQYPANIFFPAGRPGKGIGQRFKSADGRADLSIYYSRMKPAKLPQPTCGTISAWIVPRCNTLGLLGHSLPSRRSARE